MSAIVVDQVSKRYVIGHERRADTLRDALGGGARALWRRLRGRRLEREEFWALRDVSFAVEPGEVVGVIGRNGAGKSTLLKILSRITEPTTGRVALRGRVASLLEVGTGFHPELSGRENIYLNGAILGMSRAEIRRRFDEIVAFSEVERFLDTPVKRYSSGMYVRLAFAVAAHLEPEILIVDEVLAVGDAQFQKKCLGKMQEVARGQGRTVLFVSHNHAAISRLCTRGLFLEQGRVAFHGAAAEALHRYQNRGAQLLRPGVRLALDQRTGLRASPARFVSLEVRALDQAEFVSGFTPELVVEIQAERELTVQNLAFSINAGDQVKLVNADSEKLGVLLRLRPGLNRLIFRPGPLPLAPRQYQLHLWLANSRLGQVFDSVTEGLLLDLLENPACAAAAQRPENDGFLELPFRLSHEPAA